jgi:geranylgeranyl pyrophosphate synthase
LIARALAAATGEDAAVLRAGLGNPDADPEELRAILRRSGAVDAARTEAERLCNEALEALDAVPPQIAERLRGIALYSVQRAL